jgi:hypothetical protein
MNGSKPMKRALDGGLDGTLLLGGKVATLETGGNLDILVFVNEDNLVRPNRETGEHVEYA